MRYIPIKVAYLQMKRKIMGDFYIFIVLCIVLKVDCQYEQTPQSPCPDLFVYQNDGNTVHGYITLKFGGETVSNLHLWANFTLAARLPSSYIGQIQAIGNDVLQKFNRGIPIQYRVHFPVTYPLPRLTAIVVNGRRLCHGPGDVPRPHQYVTTLSLDHMLFMKGGVNPQVHNPFQTKPELNFVGQLGDNTQVFTINDIDNRDGSWNSGLYPFDPYLVMNITTPVRPTRPAYENPTPARPSRPRPEYTQRPETIAYYPELVTQAPRPMTMLPPVILPPLPLPPMPLPATAAPPIQVPPALPPIPPAPASFECGMIAGGNEVPLIFNGISYARGEWPWLVAIYKRQKGSLTFICAGTLVSQRHVVTAAHCMHQKSKLSVIGDLIVKVGVYNLEDWGDDISVTRTLESAHIHESYNATTLQNDILVFTMEKTVEFNNYIRAACLWNGDTDLGRVVGASGVVAGWGLSEVAPVGKGEPRMVRIPIVSTSTCRASKPEFHKLTSSNTLCAGDRMGSGPCLGDSGGGLYILDNGRWRLRGVVSLSLRPSNGDSTCNLDEYIVFTDAAQYVKWIKKIITQNLFDF